MIHLQGEKTGRDEGESRGVLKRLREKGSERREKEGLYYTCRKGGGGTNEKGIFQGGGGGQVKGDYGGSGKWSIIQISGENPVKIQAEAHHRSPL